MKTGEIIGALAAKKGINLRQLAIKSNVPYNTLYAIVRRKSSRIDGETLRKIAAALNVSIDSLSGGPMNASTENFDVILDIDLGKKIKKERLHCNYSQKQLAEQVGIPTKTLQQYERGEAEISLDVVERIADVLSISPTKFVGHLGNMRIMKWAMKISDNEYKERLLRAYEQLNLVGRAIAAERVEELACVPKYQINKKTAQHLGGTEGTQ